MARKPVRDLLSFFENQNVPESSQSTNNNREQEFQIYEAIENLTHGPKYNQGEGQNYDQTNASNTKNSHVSNTDEQGTTVADNFNNLNIQAITSETYKIGLDRKPSNRIPLASESTATNSKVLENILGSQRNSMALRRSVTMVNNSSLGATKGRWKSTGDVGNSAVRYSIKDDANNSHISPQNQNQPPPVPPKPNKNTRTPSCLPDLSEELEILFHSNNSVKNSSQNTERENVKKPIGIATPLIETSSKLRGSTGNLKVVFQDSKDDTRRHGITVEGDRVVVELISNGNEESASQYEEIRCDEMKPNIAKQPLKRSHTVIHHERPGSSTSLYVIQELLQTELAYLQGLQTVYKEYIVYFKASNVLCGCDFRKIFCNFEDIYKNQTNFYMALAGCNNNVDDIAETFLTNKMLFDLYKDYILNKPSSHEHLTGQCSDAIKIREQELGINLELESFLATPFQRLIRYRLLLRTLNGALEKENAPSAKLRVTIAYLDDLIEGTNLQAKLMNDKNIPLDVTKIGKLLMMDDCSWKNSGKKYYGTITLFEEVVVFTKKTQDDKYAYKDSIHLGDLYICSIVDEEKAFKLQDFTQYKIKHDERFVFRTSEIEVTLRLKIVSISKNVAVKGKRQIFYTDVKKRWT
ncbi:hypothetical protein Trydic_g13422 [Trypoxylus dichotomus]